MGPTVRSLHGCCTNTYVHGVPDLSLDGFSVSGSPAMSTKSSSVRSGSGSSSSRTSSGEDNSNDGTAANTMGYHVNHGCMRLADQGKRRLKKYRIIQKTRFVKWKKGVAAMWLNNAPAL